MVATETVDHRRELAAIGTLVRGDVSDSLRSADLSDIDGWWDTEGAARAERSVLTGRAAAARSADQYLIAHSAAAGHPGLILPPAPDANLDQIRTSLRVTGPVAFKQHLARSGSPEAAKRMMLNRVAAAAERLTLAGARDVTMQTVEAVPVIVGFQRIAQAGACKFCQMLAGRGAVYKTARTAGIEGRAFHDNCRCSAEPIYAERPAYIVRDRTPAELDARRAAAEGNAARRARIEEARQLARQRTRALSGSVDPDLLARYNITEDQYRAARAITKQVKSDIREVAAREADTLGSWLSDRDLSEMTRPARAQQRTDIITGGRSFVRESSGYDFIEQLDAAELARVRKRFTDSPVYSPDVLAEQVRRVTNLDMTDSEAMDWLTDRWLHEDGLRSLASGRVPKYADPDNLIPADYSMDGYRLELLFGVDDAEAAAHIAQVQAESAARYAERVLGRPRHGPAPWEMSADDYVRELEELDETLLGTPLDIGGQLGPADKQAAARRLELAPPDLDIDGEANPYDLFEQIRMTAQLAGLL